jgi:hypothetical protein
MVKGRISVKLKCNTFGKAAKVAKPIYIEV